MSDETEEKGQSKSESTGLACGNCGAAVEGDQRFCPNCGNALPPLPELTGQSRRSVYTARDKWTLFGGILVALLSPAAFGLGVVAAFVVYLIYRKKETPFIRGLGIGLAILTALLLGIFGVCIFFVFMAER